MDQKIDPKIIQKNNLLISNATWVAEIEAIFSASDAKKKCKTQHGTIVLAEVIHGMMPTGKSVTISSEGRPIVNDVVVRIEKDHQEIKIADAKQYVGLCLKNSRLKTIKKALARLN